MIFVKEDVQDAGFSWTIYDGYINDSRECKGDNDNDSYLWWWEMTMVDYNSDFDLINDGDCEPYEKLVQKKIVSWEDKAWVIVMVEQNNNLVELNHRLNYTSKT